jgi:DNA-binding transcriptional LysR family regulator
LIQSLFCRSIIAMTDMRGIDLNLLIVLDALLDERSVTRAAARLGYTQSTTSGMLARLRDLFDDPLFVRVQRGILPTPRAQSVAAPLKQLLADGRRLIAREAFDPATAVVTFAVSTNDYMQYALLVPFIKELQRHASKIRLAIKPPIVAGLSDALAQAVCALRYILLRRGSALRCRRPPWAILALTWPRVQSPGAFLVLALARMPRAVRAPLDLLSAGVCGEAARPALVASHADEVALFLLPAAAGATRAAASTIAIHPLHGPVRVQARE